MATATLHALTQNELRSRSATAWRHLLWKDWRQVGPLIVGIVVIQAALQLMMGVMELLMPDEMRSLATASINVALAAPTLLAIGCCGILIGQERQNGTWMWSSSLPVSWRRSLMSKLVIWLVSSAVAVGLLLGVAAVVLAMNQRGLVQELLQANQPQNFSAWTYLLSLVIAVQVCIYFSLAALLIRDTLMAFVVAAVGLFAFHIIVTVIFAENLYRGNAALVFSTAYALSFVVGAVCLAIVYRWRWGVGQYSPLIGRTGSVGYARPQRAAWQSYAGAATQPSEFRMLLHHGFRASMGLRIAVVVGASLLSFLGIAENQLEPSLFAACLASCIWGVSVFAGDQPMNRFRFFADRGVCWKRFLVAHTLPPALLVTLCCGFVCLAKSTTNFNDDVNLFPLLLCVPFFLVGMFSSLAFPSPIISLTMSFVTLFGGTALSLSAIAIWDIVHPGRHWDAIAIWFPVSTLILLVVVIRMVPRWLQVDRLKATAIYFGTVAVAAALPMVLGLSFAFLSIPRVEWQGLQLNQIREVDWTGGPDLTPRKNEPVLIGVPIGRALPTEESLNGFNLSTEIIEQTLAQMLEQGNDSSAWFKARADRLEAIENGGASAEKLGFDEVRMLNGLLQDSAIIALMATDKKEKEIAVRAWKANRKLIAFCQQPALLTETMESTTFAWEVWDTMTDQHLEFLSEAGDLAELTPPAPPTMEEVRYVLKSRATVRQAVSSGSYGSDWEKLSRVSMYASSFYGLSPFEKYPPLRWAYERQQAIGLQQDLATREGPEGAYLSFSQIGFDRSRFRDPELLRRYQVLRFLSYRLEDRFRKLR